MGEFKSKVFVYFFHFACFFFFLLIPFANAWKEKKTCKNFSLGNVKRSSYTSSHLASITILKILSPSLKEKVEDKLKNR